MYYDRGNDDIYSEFIAATSILYYNHKSVLLINTRIKSENVGYYADGDPWMIKSKQENVSRELRHD